MPVIVKFICHLYDSEVSWSVVLTSISAISKYHVVDKFTGTKTSNTQIMWDLRYHCHIEIHRKFGKE